MNRIKIRRRSNYTSINNAIIRDKRITLKAKGLLITTMSLPPDWNFTVGGIASVLKEGERAVYSAIHELMDAGYVDRQRIYDDRGKISGWEYTFYDETQKVSFLDREKIATKERKQGLLSHLDVF